MSRVKKHLLCLFGVVAVLVGTIGCKEGNSAEVLQLYRSWRLITFCNAPADVDIYINLGTDGKFTIYQRTEDFSYSVFKGEYFIDNATSTMSGVYSDGTPWSSSYLYELDTIERQLVLESVENHDEVAVYVPAEMPKIDTRSIGIAPTSDVKPL